MPSAGPSIDKAEVDIIFVHGLNGSPRHTWCNSDQSIVWPTEFLPQELPSARIFYYGYNVLSHVWDLNDGLSSEFDVFLQRLQTSREERQIPIVFIAHSLGGLIVRDALCREHHDPKIGVLDHIRWVCFLGTPNFASEDAWIQYGRQVAQDQAFKPGKNVDLLPRMLSVNKQFDGMLRCRPKKKIEISCFYEVLPVAGNGLLAPQAASTLAGHESTAVLKDHYGTCKLENTLDPVYRSICEHIRANSYESTVTENTFRTSSPVSGRRKSSSDGREMALDTASTPADVKDPTRLALALEDRGRMNAAYEALTTLVSTTLKTPLAEASPDDWIVFFCHDKQASVLRKCGRFEEAERKCREVLDVKRRVLGAGVPSTLDTIGNLALILRSRGQFTEAIQILTDNLEPAPEYFHEPIVQIKLFSILAKVYKDIGYFDLAELLARDVLIASIRQFGIEHSFTLTRASDLAVVLAKTQKYDFAEELSMRALSLLERLLGSDHRYCLRASQRLAFINLLQGKLSAAAKRFEGTRLLQQEQLGFYHQNTLSSTCGLGVALIRQGKVEDGKVYLKSAYRGQKDRLGETHPDTLWTAHVLEHLNHPLTKHDPLTLPSEKIPNLHDFLRRPSRPQDLHSMFPEVSSISVPAITDSREPLNLKLRLAAFHGDREEVNEALKGGAEINAVGGIFGTPLQAACYAGRKEVVEELLSRKGVDVNVQGGLFGTPLRAAAFSGHVDLVTRLLKNEKSKAQPNITDGIRGSALGAALIVDNTRAVRALLDGGANKYSNDDIYGTALHEAAMNGQREMVEIFLEEGANPNIRAGLFGTAIEASAWGGHTATISLLLGKGASLDNRYESRNAVYLASARGHTEALNLLLQKVKELKEKSRTLRRDASGSMLHAALSQSPPASKSGKSSDERRRKANPAPAPLPTRRRHRSPVQVVKRCSHRLAHRLRRVKEVG